MGGSNNLFSLLIIIIPIVLIFWFFNKKKNKKNGTGVTGQVQSKNERKDEVWKTVKQFLQEHGERGKEVSYSFVAKRNNPTQDKKLKKVFKQETEDYIKKNHLDKIQARRHRDQRQKLAAKELYCIYFITRDPKTKIKDPARIIEAEVVQTNTGNKKEPVKRSIVINGLQDFETEFKWIEPIKKREDEKIAKLEKQKEARAAKKRLRHEKRLQRKITKKAPVQSPGTTT